MRIWNGRNGVSLGDWMGVWVALGVRYYCISAGVGVGYALIGVLKGLVQWIQYYSTNYDLDIYSISQLLHLDS